MATLEDALATLATVPPKAFARQRDALVAQLRDAGDTTTAAQVKARRVPTLPVWVVNRLALEHHDDVEAFIAATARVKAAQLGRGPGGALATATAGHRAALERLRERAGVILREAGGVTADKLLRVQNTLTAAAVDAKARTALQAGRARRRADGAGLRRLRRRAAPGDAPRRAGGGAAQQDHGHAGTDRSGGAGCGEGRGAARRAREVQRAQRQERMAQARTAVTEAEQKAASAHRDLTAAKGRLRELLEQAQEARRDLRERTAAARQQDAAVTRAQRRLRTAARKAGG